jgi:hypothetical protein
MQLTRRTTLKAIAAALMAPTIRLRPEIDREALMRPFCDTTEGYRYQTNEPFQQGSLTYCTDSRRIIRAELTLTEIVGERRLPNAVGLWGQHWHPSQWIEIERPEISQLLIPIGNDYGSTCPQCLGRRISLGDQYPDENDPRLINYDPDDNTIGDESCSLCRGLDYFGPSEMEIGGHRFAYRLMAPIFDLPGVKFSPPKHKEEPGLFLADGFEGMLMPLAYE